MQANDNEITDWNSIDNLKNNSKLQTVYMERNPIEKDIQYRMKIKLAVPVS